MSKALSPLLLLALTCPVIAGPRPQDGNCDKPFRSPFRYVIYSDKAYSFGRGVSVLLDDNAFSESTLKILFQLLSQKYRDEKTLHVWVVTNLEAASTPEEEEAPKVSESTCRNPDDGKYNRALYVRTVGDEFFRYNPALPNRGLSKTVYLRRKGQPVQ